MWKALLRAGEQVGRCQVERLMRAARDPGREAARQAVAHHDAGPGRPQRPPDLVERDFMAPGAEPLWVGDFTYLRCWEGVVYFSFVIDVFSRMVVGWQFASQHAHDARAGRAADGARDPDRRAPTSR